MPMRQLVAEVWAWVCPHILCSLVTQPRAFRGLGYETNILWWSVAFQYSWTTLASHTLQSQGSGDHCIANCSVGMQWLQKMQTMRGRLYCARAASKAFPSNKFKYLTWLDTTKSCRQNNSWSLDPSFPWIGGCGTRDYSWTWSVRGCPLFIWTRKEYLVHPIPLSPLSSWPHEMMEVPIEKY